MRISIDQANFIGVPPPFSFLPLSVFYCLLHSPAFALFQMSAAVAGGIELSSSKVNFDRISSNNSRSDTDANVDDDTDDDSSIDDVGDPAIHVDQYKVSTIVQDLKTALIAARYVFLILLCLSLLLMYQFTIAPYLINPWKNHVDGIVNTAEKLVRSICNFFTSL